MGLEIDPPDINRSSPLFTVVDGRIVYGFLGIKGIGEGPAQEILRCRREGPYKDFMDFLNRTDIKTVPKAVVEKLIQTGAFDRFGVPRETLLGNLERAVDYAKGIREEKNIGQVSLFGEPEEQGDFIFEPFPQLGKQDRLKLEKDLIGFYFSGHPLDDYKDLWQRIVRVDLGKPEELKPGPAILLGIIQSVKAIIAKGRKMAFATLADYNGEMEVTFFSSAWETCQDKVSQDRVTIIKGKIDYQKDKDKISFLADTVLEPEEALAEAEKEAALTKQLDEYRPVWAGEVKVNLAAPETANPKEDYTLVGIIRDIRSFHTKNGNDMGYGVLADYNGEIGVTLFAKAWGELQNKLEEGRVVCLRGKIKKDTYKNRYTFYPDSSLSLDRLKGRYARAGTPPPVPDAPAPQGSGSSPRGGGTAGSASGLPAGSSVPGGGGFGSALTELHIRLREGAAAQDRELLFLREHLLGSPGPCPVFIHVPAGPGEAVVRTTSRIGSILAPEALEKVTRCSAVAEAWGE